MAPSSRRPIPGVAGLIERRGSVLLVRRGNEPNRGRWSLPGGGIRLGETLRLAVVREVWEETGLAVSADRLVDVVDILIPPTGRPEYHFVVAVFRCRPVRGRLRAGSDATEAKWVPLDEVPRMDLTENTRALLLRRASRRTTSRSRASYM